MVNVRMKAVMEEKNINVVTGPSSLNYIDNNLWLGNLAAASDKDLLERKKIKYILTVNSFPLPKKIIDLENIKTKFVKVFDTSRDDILSYFEETYEFIEYAIKKGAVLIHCYLGVSRSPTIIIAYLMKKKNMKVKEALDYVRSKRQLVEPNPGFLAQLRLYEVMHCTIDKCNIQYKMFRLYITVDHVKKEHGVPEYCSDVIKPDPLLVTIGTDLTAYKCRNCRRVVARGSNIIPHVSTEEYNWRDSKWSESLEKAEVCQLSYFIEPLEWMKNVTLSVEGKLHCPNSVCKNKLGFFSWVPGGQCPCGTQVCPAFYLIPSKVDKQYCLPLKDVKECSHLPRVQK